MLYINKNLDKIYKELIELVDGETKVKLYGFNYYFDDEKFVADFEKTVNDLKQISTSGEDFFIIEVENKNFKKLSDLELYDLIEIFFDIVPENKFSIYSDNLTEEDFNKLFNKFREDKYLEDFYICNLFNWINTYQENSKKERILWNGIKYTKKDFLSLIKSQYDTKFLISFIENYSESMKKIDAEYFKSNTEYFIEKFFEEDFNIGMLEKYQLCGLIKDREINNYFYSLYKLSCNKKSLNQVKNFIYLHNFLAKPIENFIDEDIKNLLSLNLNFDIIENLPGIQSMENKFELMKISTYDKIQEYFLINRKKANEVDKYFPNIEGNTFIKNAKQAILTCNSKTKYYEYKDISALYIKFFNKNKIEDTKIKYYFCNDFRRLYLYYKINFLKKINEEELKIREVISNFTKIINGERNIGVENYSKVIEIFKKNNDEEKVLQIQKYHILYKKYEELKYLIDTNIDLNIKESDILIKYNNISGFYKEKEFLLKKSRFSISYLINNKILEYSYYNKEIVKKFTGEYYIVETKDEIDILKYLDEKNEELYFLDDSGIRFFNKKDVKVYQIKTLKFLDKYSNEENKNSLF